MNFTDDDPHQSDRASDPRSSLQVNRGSRRITRGTPISGSQEILRYCSFTFFMTSGGLGTLSADSGDHLRQPENQTQPSCKREAVQFWPVSFGTSEGRSAVYIYDILTTILQTSPGLKCTSRVHGPLYERKTRCALWCRFHVIPSGLTSESAQSPLRRVPWCHRPRCGCLHSQWPATIPHPLSRSPVCAQCRLTRRARLLRR